MAEEAMDKESHTGRLCTWIANVTLDDIPEDILVRSKYLILDGLACVLVGAHLPSSEKAVKVVVEMESPGPATIFGWDKVWRSNLPLAPVIDTGGGRQETDGLMKYLWLCVNRKSAP